MPPQPKHWIPLMEVRNYFSVLVEPAVTAALSFFGMASFKDVLSHNRFFHQTEEEKKRYFDSVFENSFKSIFCKKLPLQMGRRRIMS